MRVERPRHHVVNVVRDVRHAVVFRAASVRSWTPPQDYPRGARSPVVVLPGVYETWHYLRPVVEVLHDSGHPVHVIPELGLNRDPVPVSAPRVWRVLIDRGLHDVAIVGHSKGGIIGKYLLALEDRDGRVDRVVAIASPFGGSSMARLAPARPLRDFLPTDQTVRQLADQVEVNARITSIFPTYDAHIPEGSALDGARNIELDGRGHFGILRDPRLPQLVVDEVERIGAAQ